MKKNSSEFREMQRERIQKTRPWELSTGPRTIYGKDKSKMNALKMNPILYSLIKELNEFTKQRKITNHKASIELME